jgi:ribonuclease H2 subunit A
MPLPEPSLEYPQSRVDNILEGVEYVAGIDEAGRGPVLGPLVYCLFLCPVHQQHILKSDFKAADSKVISHEERKVFFKKCIADPDMCWLTRVLSPVDISDAMLRPNKYNLNELSYDTVYSLLEEAFKLGFKVKHLFVDTLGPPASYKERLENRFTEKLRGGRVTVAPKADSLYPPVSAASIIAKVTRDDCLLRWSFPAHEIEIKSRDFGCGYPGDPLTVKWLHDHVHPVLGFPDIVRFSWSSSARILEEKAIPFLFAGEQIEVHPTVKKRKEQEQENVVLPQGALQFHKLAPLMHDFN